jgi:hypothetical protein
MKRIKIKGGSDGQEDNNMFVAPLDWVDTMNRMLKLANIEGRFSYKILELEEDDDRRCILYLNINDIEVETEVLDVK